MTEGIADKLFGLAKKGSGGARATAGYYAASSKDERQIVRASFFTGAVGGILWYVLILFWVSLQFSSEEIGLMLAAGSVIGMIAYLFGGYLADSLGRKKVLLFGLVCEAAGLVMFLTPKSFAVFSIAYGLTSVGSSVNWPALTAWMGDKASPANMKYLFGIQQFYNQAGLTISAFLGIFVPPVLETNHLMTLSSGYLWVFLAAAVCAFVPIAFIWRVSETRRPPERLIMSFDRKMRGIFLKYGVQNAVIGAGAALVIPWFPVIFEDGMNATGPQVALIIAISNTAIAFGWLAVPKFADVRGSVALITVCQIVSVLPLVLIPFSEFSLVLVGGLYTARSLLMLIPTPVLYAYLVNIVAERIRASFLAYSQLFWALAYAGASAIAGYLWANDYGRPLPFILCGALYVAGSVLFFAFFRNIREPHEHGAA